MPTHKMAEAQEFFDTWKYGSKQTEDEAEAQAILGLKDYSEGSEKALTVW